MNSEIKEYRGKLIERFHKAIRDDRCPVPPSILSSSDFDVNLKIENPNGEEYVGIIFSAGLMFRIYHTVKVKRETVVNRLFGSKVKVDYYYRQYDFGELELSDEMKKAIDKPATIHFTTERR